MTIVHHSAEPAVSNDAGLAENASADGHPKAVPRRRRKPRRPPHHENPGKKLAFELEQRRQAVNDLLVCIGSCGRRFFHHEGRFSRFELFPHVGPRQRLYLIDKYRESRIYMHHYAPGWRFSDGGTLWRLCRALARYIWSGQKLNGHFGPWHDDVCRGDLWGYGNSMQEVRERASALGIWEKP